MMKNDENVSNEIVKIGPTLFFSLAMIDHGQILNIYTPESTHLMIDHGLSLKKVPSLSFMIDRAHFNALC